MPSDSPRLRHDFIRPLDADPFALDDFAPESVPRAEEVSTDQFRFSSHDNGPAVAEVRQATSPFAYATPVLRAFAAVALVLLSAIAGYLAVWNGAVSGVPEQAAAVRRDESPGVTPSQALSPADLSGSWEVTNLIQDSSYASYEGLRLGYRFELQQDGDRVTGRGEKLSENGRSISAAVRTGIELTGTIEGQRVALAFTERGVRRSSVGTFDLQWTDDGVLRGWFESDVARSRGTTVAHKVPASMVKR